MSAGFLLLFTHESQEKKLSEAAGAPIAIYEDMVKAEKKKSLEAAAAAKEKARVAAARKAEAEQGEGSHASKEAFGRPKGKAKPKGRPPKPKEASARLLEPVGAKNAEERKGGPAWMFYLESGSSSSTASASCVRRRPTVNRVPPPTP